MFLDSFGSSFLWDVFLSIQNIFMEMRTCFEQSMFVRAYFNQTLAVYCILNFFKQKLIYCVANIFSQLLQVFG